MNRRFVTAFLAMAMALPLAAQNASAHQGDTAQAPPAWGHGAYGTHRGRPGMRIMQRLNLTQEQKQKLQPIFQQHRQQAQAVRKDTSLTSDQKKEKLAQLRQDFESQVNSVLTPEQQAQLKQFREQRKPPLARLNLSDDQKARIKPLFEQQHQQVMAVRQDSSLSPQQKRDKIRDIRQNTMVQVNGILSPEQQQQWEQMRQQRRHRWQPMRPNSQPQAAPPQGI